ncbi:HtaA domain-containing protein [Corynebacterium meitnerae]|uniref:HtaA domain-containing protein n=1 Tax=Corynebacterium meitnerae TaxID=2913498 RepID=A0A9X3LTV9_9CORY|nr:HtaA domain-containing protein [Corynebacterium meitnerae]MCZ9293686.1 HtaA domain-containing protein [Corynebacterium meitnerae]
MSRAFFTRSLLAAGTAAAVTAGVFVAPHAGAQESPTNAAAPVQDVAQEGLLKAGDVKSGTVSWPIKASFLRYLQSSAAGKITLSEGVSAKEEAGKATNFNFPIDPEKSHIDANGNGELALFGKIEFLGHEGLGKGRTWGMDVAYSNFKIKVEGKKGYIIADYKLKGALPDQEQHDESVSQAVLASFDLSRPLQPEGQENNTSTKVVLEQGGVDSLLNYKKGETLSSVTLAPLFAKEGDKPVKPNKAEGKVYDFTKKAGLNLKTLIGVGVALALLAVLGAVGAWFAGLIPGVPAPR